MDYLISLIAVAILLLVFGIGYALYIYKNPPQDGKTYWSVVIGVGVTLIGIFIADLATLIYFDLLDLWWTAFFPSAAFGLTGLPMAATQELKRREQLNHNKNLFDPRGK